MFYCERNIVIPLIILLIPSLPDYFIHNFHYKISLIDHCIYYNVGFITLYHRFTARGIAQHLGGLPKVLDIMIITMTIWNLVAICIIITNMNIKIIIIFEIHVNELNSPFAHILFTGFLKEERKANKRE